MFNNELEDEVAVAHWAMEGEKTYEELVDRVINHLFAEPSPSGHSKEIFKDLLLNKKLIPNSPCWMNAGTERKSLAACFVLPVEDSMESIFKAATDMALIMKEGGGVGIPLSNMRPENSQVKTTKGVSSGPISFLKVFNQIVETVKQGGTRRGAALGNMLVNHPDIMKLIRCKSAEGEISNFNLSVAITDKFMAAIEKGENTFILQHPESESIMIDPNTIMDAIVDGMWNNGEPGIQFIDTVNRLHLPYLMDYAKFNTFIETSNPCSEAFLAAYESCLLAAINLWKYVLAPWHPENNTGAAMLNIEALKEDVALAVHFLNRMLDVTEAPLPMINERTREARKIGLGVMGLADVLSAAGTRYGKYEAVKLTEYLLDIINTTAEDVSKEYGYENAMITLIAPTGTTGLVGGVSGGIEPHFKLTYNRKSIKLGELNMGTASLESYLDTLDMADAASIRQVLMDNEGAFPDDHPMQNSWPTAGQITPKEHVDMLAAVQKHVHNAVSKTINLPNDYKKEDLRELIIYAYNKKVKGFTVYREGSRDKEVLYTKKEDTSLYDAIMEENDKAIRRATDAVCVGTQPISMKRDRAGVTYGSTVKAKIGCGSLYVTTNKDEFGPCEVFTNLGRSGGCPSQSEATSRLISLCLRSGVDIDEVIDQLVGIRCLSTIGKKDKGRLPDGRIVLSCPDAIGKALMDLKTLSVEETPVEGKCSGDCADNCLECLVSPEDTPVEDTAECPKCENILQHTGGCLVCNSCGWSKCG